MKVLVVGDIHWSTYSSILRSRGEHFSTRLEYLIKSLSWVEQVAKENNCEEEIFLGDTFDKPDLTSEEITALTEVEWNNSSRIKHFIVGNHESGVSSLVYNSTQVLNRLGVVEDTPYVYPVDDKTEFLFLPYITEDNRKSISEYMKERTAGKKLIAFSHNDIKDFQMGMFLSKTGFSIDEIEQNCDLYINGHLHNGGWVGKNQKILNLGNLTGQNFSEDASKYSHRACVLDTDTLELTFLENPYAMNFYKMDVDKSTDIAKKLISIKNNSIISFKCLDTREKELRDELALCPRVLTYKILTYSEAVVSTEEVENINLGVDHLKHFQEFILENLGSDDIVKEELNEVCKVM